MTTAELLAPAGDFETALAAFDAGADAVYCGLADYSARAFAQNLSPDDLKRLMRVARVKGKKVYVTFNTVLDEDQLEGAVEALATLAEIGPDALIVQDLGVARICRRHFPELALHASTQMVAHNLEGVLALGELGFTRVVLARELSLEEIASIAKRCGDVELECFIHGALCYSLSGLCLFGAMEKGRSGNRGKCPYCCRLSYENAEGAKTLAFSMKDLRVGEDVKKLVEAGVASLKIEGRMKSPLYVASVTLWYRQMLGGEKTTSVRQQEKTTSVRQQEKTTSVRQQDWVTSADLETVFSRRTTELYLNGGRGATRPTDGVIDPASLGHLGTPIGTVKRVTKDREGRAWLRFHTSRALEKHDGLQFANPAGGKPLGLGIAEMRQTISRTPVFEVAAGTDVEIALPENDVEVGAAIRPGATVYCSMSNAVKRMFPIPSYRESDYPGTWGVDVAVTIEAARVVARGRIVHEFHEFSRIEETVEIAGTFEGAKSPEKTLGAVRRAFEKLGGTDYRLGELTLVDKEKRFVPASVLNDLRRDLVERLDARRAAWRCEAVAAALEGDGEPRVAWGEDNKRTTTSLECVEEDNKRTTTRRCVKVRAGQSVPPGEWDEVIVAINAETTNCQLPTTNCQLPTANCQLPTANCQLPTANCQLPTTNCQLSTRLALPVYTPEPEFNKLRNAVKRFLRAGYAKWEASDLATLRMLRQLGVTDITADWTLYAFNARALAALSELGVKRFVASPENGRENRQFLAESGYDVELLVQQSTPLFISLTKPMAQTELAVYPRDGLWVTTKLVPRTFDAPSGDVATRVDLSWDAL